MVLKLLQILSWRYIKCFLSSHRHEVESCADSWSQPQIARLSRPVNLPVFWEMRENGVAGFHITTHHDSFGQCATSKKDDNAHNYQYSPFFYISTWRGGTKIKSYNVSNLLSLAFYLTDLYHTLQFSIFWRTSVSPREWQGQDAKAATALPSTFQAARGFFYVPHRCFLPAIVWNVASALSSLCAQTSKSKHFQVSYKGSTFCSVILNVW